MLSFPYYGTKCFSFIFGAGHSYLYKWFYILTLPLGATATLGTVVGSNTVQVEIQGSIDSTVFTATGTPDNPNIIVMISGNSQTATVGNPVTNPYVVEVRDQYGNTVAFIMNDKCAAGTGRFLEVLTERILNITLEELGPLSLKSKSPCILSSVCTVFAESEIISLLSEKRAKEDIAAGLHRAIAKRVIGMGITGQISYDEPIVFSGGVAKNIGVVKAIEEELRRKVVTLEEPQITAALGAAILAQERSEQTRD